MHTPAQINEQTIERTNKQTNQPTNQPSIHLQDNQMPENESPSDAAAAAATGGGPSHVEPEPLPPTQPPAMYASPMYHHHPHHHHHHHPGYFDTVPGQHTHLGMPDHVAMMPSGGGSDKSASPIQSSTTTTGTTTTTEPSVGSPNENVPGDAPVFPTESLTNVPENQQVFLGMAPRYQHHHQQATVPYPSGGGVGVGSEENPQRYNPAQFPAALKLLVSNNVAGSIIGRQGQTISELQNKSSTRIKLSQTGDYYPGTQERVCLVQGDPANVKSATALLLKRIHTLQEQQHAQHVAAWQLQREQPSTDVPAFDFVVKLLVPTSSCGMIIGKSGSNIKFLEETTGVTSVRLSPKEAGDHQAYPPAVIMAATSERILTVTGPGLDNCVACLHQIVDGMTAHPDICRYTNMTTSYSRLMQPEAMGYPNAPRPVLVSVPPMSPRHHPMVGAPWEGGMGPTYAPPPSGPVPRRVTSSPDMHGLLVGQRPDTAADRLAGYNAAMGMPAHFSPIAPMAPVDPLNPSAPGIPRIPSVDGIHPNMSHSSSAPDLLAYQLEHSMHLTPPPPSPVGTDYLVPVAPTCVGPNQWQAQVLIPDTMIGSILGRGGRTLTELQALSGTRIRISQRGEFLPGTRDRIVTIRGPTAQAIWQVQMMMSQRIVLPPTAATAFESNEPAAPDPASSS